MKYIDLIQQSKAKLEQNSNAINSPISINIFALGAKWMFEKLNETNKNAKFDDRTNYHAYGFLKYGISLIAFFIALLLLSKISIFLIPFSIFVFYFFEVQLLFLFPLLLDKVQNPIWSSVKQTYKIGIFTAMITVIPIGLYMVWGLLNFKNPYKNWHIGCYSIIIWYKNEIRNRLSS